jgi:hypothetical protein
MAVKNKPVRYVSNAKKVNWTVAQASREAAWMAGQLIITLATNNVPLDTGTLRRSAIVTDELPSMQEIYERAKSIDQTKTPISATNILTGKVKLHISYNTPYAAWLHETTKWKPRPWKRMPDGGVDVKPAVGGPKWLENALNIVRPQIGKIIQRAFKKRGVSQ